METKSEAKFAVGQIIHHALFEYRGVIVDVDPNFQHSELWYSLMAQSRPNKEQPWYHILVNDTDYMTYVAESNLEPDKMGGKINHPQIKEYFTEYKDGVYLLKIPAH